MSLEKYIRDIQDFPKEGIMFKDITPLLINAEEKSALISGCGSVKSKDR
jgi:adenine phosphoribosyltransferase